jgi:hypothetical protein
MVTVVVLCIYRRQQASEVSIPQHRDKTIQTNLLRTDPSGQQDPRQKASIEAMMKDARSLVCSLERSELGNTSGSPIQLIESQFLASYNWSKAEKPTIFIPG